MLEAWVPRDRPQDTPTAGAREGDEPRAEQRLRCAACGAEVTESSARIEVAGAHRHVFCNPHGHVFEIGCFSRAPGVLAIGEPSAFFSWFPGYSWRVAVCASCRAHLGWCYGDGAAFVGLILPRLVDDDG